jgi:hypothetical protein
MSRFTLYRYTVTFICAIAYQTPSRPELCFRNQSRIITANKAFRQKNGGNGACRCEYPMRRLSHASFMCEYPVRKPSHESFRCDYPERKPSNASFSCDCPVRRLSHASFRCEYPMRKPSHASFKCDCPVRRPSHASRISVCSIRETTISNIYLKIKLLYKFLKQINYARNYITY